MNIWTITWRYLDGSGSGVLPKAYTSEENARHLLELLNNEVTMKVFDVACVEVMTCEKGEERKEIIPRWRHAPEGGTPLWQLSISIRASNILKMEGIETIEQLLLCTENDLHRMPGMGPKSVEDIKSTLANRGLRLA